MFFDFQDECEDPPQFIQFADDEIYQAKMLHLAAVQAKIINDNFDEQVYYTNQVEQETSDLRSQIDSLTTSKTDVEKKLIDSKAECENIRNQNAAMANTTKSMKEEISRLIDNLARLNAEKEDATSQLEKANLTIKSLSTRGASSRSNSKASSKSSPTDNDASNSSRSQPTVPAQSTSSTEVFPVPARVTVRKAAGKAAAGRPPVATTARKRKGPSVEEKKDEETNSNQPQKATARKKPPVETKTQRSASMDVSEKKPDEKVSARATQSTGNKSFARKATSRGPSQSKEAAEGPAAKTTREATLLSTRTPIRDRLRSRSRQKT